MSWYVFWPHPVDWHDIMPSMRGLVTKPPNTDAPAFFPANVCHDVLFSTFSAKYWNYYFDEFNIISIVRTCNKNED